MDNRRHFRVIVAIDFGTSRSGFVYAFTGTKGDPTLYDRIKWPDMPFETPKTLTHLFYAPTGAPEAWGASARRRLAELQREGKDKDYTFVQNFKMDLRNNKTPDGPITLRGNKTFHTEDLIADYLRFLKEMALADLASTLGSSLNVEEVLWCLTVPAIWTDAEKQVMRTAAQKAGLIRPLAADADRLLFALEPEAAAFHCAKRAAVDMKVGTRFMVVDCGGGTADITSFEVLADGEYKALTTADGGPYGSTYVDQEFLRYLREQITIDATNKFQTLEPTGYVQLIEAWETIKCQHDPDKGASTIWFEFPKRLQKLLETEYPSVLQKLLEKQSDNQGLDIPNSDMQQFFEPSLKGIEAAIQQQFKQLEKAHLPCDFIFLVGGFSAASILQKRIKEKFGNRVKDIVVPETPGGAVVKGAIYFANAPEGVPIRPVPFTYGCSFLAPFRKDIDPIDKRRITNTGQIFCKDRFDVFVSANQSVGFDQSVTRGYSPLDSDATSMKLAIFATKEPDPLYVDGKDVMKLGEIEVKMPDTTGGTSRRVAVTMKFGQTELSVSALDETTHQKYDATLKLDPSL